MSWFEVIFLSFIEGLTEYLPISSTGHLIIVSSLLKINDSVFVQNFNIIIQFGAILAVLTLYPKKFLNIDKLFYRNLIVAFLPAAVIGFIAKKHLDALLSNVLIVGVTLVIGGIILIKVDKLFEQNTKKLNNLDLIQFLKIGFFQCLAFIPGVSRSAATIIGSQIYGLDRSQAAEFSFFLAVPTLTAAALYKSYKIIPNIEVDQIQFLIAGIILSYFFALIFIKSFISIIKKWGLLYFGYYRILLGIIVICLVYANKL